PLADTRRNGVPLPDRQREISPQPRVQHPLSNRARGPVAAPAKVRNPLGDQPVQLNFVDAEIQAVVRALSRATGQQFLVD
ncbi:MAG: type II secretion system protein GspD, partial [Pseudomonas sp.]